MRYCQFAEAGEPTFGAGAEDAAPACCVAALAVKLFIGCVPPCPCAPVAPVFICVRSIALPPKMLFTSTIVTLQGLAISTPGTLSGLA